MSEKFSSGTLNPKLIKNQECLVPSLASLVDTGPVVLEKKILNFTILLFSSLGKGHGPLIEQTWIFFVPTLAEIGTVVGSGEEVI